MHGDEPTATLAFLDLFNFFQGDDEYNSIRQRILEHCTLHFIPMLNPDGAMAYQRRNAQGIDLNRDFLAPQSPEAKLLVKLQQEIKPDFGFNMHDQDTLWSVTGTNNPAAISLSAPPPDEQASVPECRSRAMQVISSIFELIKQEIPGHIGRWQEEYEPRSFGDNFQALGVSTILVESGGYPLDFEKQHVRKLNFDILIHALSQIATKEYLTREIAPYYTIPFNNKALFHILIKNCRMETGAGTIAVDLGVNYTEVVVVERQKSTKTYTLVDMGDLSTWNGYDIIDARGALLLSPIKIDTKADFRIIDDGNILIQFENGSLIN